MSYRKRAIIAAVSIVLLYIILRLYLKERFPDSDHIIYTLQNSGAWGPLFFIVLSMVRGLMLFPPNATVFLISGLVFGPVYGPVYALFGGLACAMVEFAIARYLGLPAVKRIVGSKTKIPDLEPLISTSSIMLLRFVMFGPPFDLANYGLGLTRASWRNYLIGTTLGLIPSAILFTQFGYSMTQSLSKLPVAITVIVTIVSAIMLMSRYKTWRILQAQGNRNTQVILDFDIGKEIGTVKITFPSQQDGLSTMCGFFSYSGVDYVIKFMRTRTIGNWGHAISLRKYLGSLPIKDNIFSASDEVFQNVSTYIQRCNEKLIHVTQEKAARALFFSFEFARKNRILIDDVLNEFFTADRTTIDFFPAHSFVFRTVNPLESNDPTIAIVQKDIRQFTASPIVNAYLFSSAGDIKKQERVFHIGMLILAALAYETSHKELLGFDLFPHLVSFYPIKIKFPNVLLGTIDQPLFYVDVVGLFSSDGNLIQRVGNNILYGKMGFIPVYGKMIFNALVRDSSV